MTKADKFNLKIHKIENKIETDKYFYIFSYTILFVFIFTIMFATFFLSGRSFVRNVDGYSQHLKTLMYIRKYYTEALVNKTFPSYDFNLGLGGNVLTTLTYYGFFDPLNIISAFIPLRYTEYLYGFLIMLRVYLSGLTFIFMCKHFEKKKMDSILGALIYISSSYVIFLGIKHPFFLNPMLYLPILIVGLDLILQKKKPYVFLFGISFSSLSGFYFLYMMTIMLFLFANVRFLELYKDSFHKIKEYFKAFFMVTCYYILGVGIASSVLIPNIILFLESDRITQVKGLYTNFALKYLGNISSLFDVAGEGPECRIQVIVLFTLIIALIKYIKNKKNILILILISILGLGLPFFGSMMNGFAYPTNRWSFGLLLLFSYIFVDTMEEFLNRKYENIVIAVLMLFNIFNITYFFINGNRYKIIGIILIDIYFFILYFSHRYFKRNIKNYKNNEILILLLLIMINAGVSGMFMHYFGERVYQYNKYNNFSRYNNSQEMFFKKLDYMLGDREEFFRVSGSNFSLNQALIAGIHSSNFYFSINNKYIIDFIEKLQIAAHGNRCTYKGVDERMVSDNLISNRYFITKPELSGRVPHGYTLKKSYEKYDIYENEQFLPFGYTYDKYTTYDEAEGEFSLDKEVNMLDMVYLDKEINNIKKGTVKNYSREVPYEVDRDTVKKHRRSKQLRLNFDNAETWETYIYIEPIHIKGRSKKSDIKIKSINVEKMDDIKSRNNPFYFSRHSLLVNLGNVGNIKKWCELTFTQKMRYSLSNVKVLSIPMDGFAEKINKLKGEHLQDVNFGTDRVSGHICLKNPKILTMSIPYERGWKAYVNGKEAPILRGNYMFSCLVLEPGEHYIEMVYHTPGGRISNVISIISLIILGNIIIIDKRKKRDGSISNSSML